MLGFVLYEPVLPRATMVVSQTINFDQMHRLNEPILTLPLRPLEGSLWVDLLAAPRRQLSATGDFLDWKPSQQSLVQVVLLVEAA